MENNFWTSSKPVAYVSDFYLFLTVAVQESDVTTHVDDVSQHTGSQTGYLLTDDDNLKGTTTYASQSSAATSSSARG